MIAAVLEGQRITWVFLSVLFLAIGSFLNVVIYRLPQKLHAEWTTGCRTLLGLPPQPSSTLTLSLPRSHCPTCQTPIPFWHNIPLISYALLRGRCHHCHTAISLRYPGVEMTCLLLSLIAVWFFKEQSLFVLPFIWIMICIFFIDLEKKIIPDPLSLSLLWLGLFANTTSLFTPLANAVFSAAGAYLTLWLVIKGYFLITKKIGMGHGDFKLFAALGAWFGWENLPFILLIASTSGVIVGLLYLKKTRQSRETPLPFGSFLCVAGIIALMYRPYT